MRTLVLIAAVVVLASASAQAGESRSLSAYPVSNDTTATVQPAVLKFNQATTGGATVPWTPPFMESVTLSAISLPAGATLFLHTPDTASTLTQG